jgi:23S rRNA U2552 (ribose-2'-O)-methylase RlmE/FtsJ
MSTVKHTPPWEKIKWNSRLSQIQMDDTAFVSEEQWKYNTPTDLTTIKDKIALLNEDVWEYYKKLSNPYELIFITNGIVPVPQSVCILHPLSRSYFKMIEIIQISNCFAKFQLQGLRTAHVCEGPGGFIQALYDEADRNRKRITQTYAMTLRPIENQVPGWKRAMSFLKKHPEIKILYGANNTGDILDAANRQSFYNECKNGVHIFTADGGIDFTSNYEEQEKIIYPLLIASSLMGLKCLTEGGIFVLKIFDCFSRASEDLIYALGTCFNTWSLYKPATSRPCNSEQYFIGVGYRTIHGMSIAKIFEQILAAPFVVNHFLKEESLQKITEFREQQAAHSNIQIQSIRHTLELTEENNIEKHTETWNKHICASQNFCKQFHLPIVQKPENISLLENSIGIALKKLQTASLSA